LLLGEATDALCEFFCENADVDALVFVRTNIQRSQSLMASLMRIKSLSTLCFSGCHLSDGDVDHLVASFDGLVHLASLDISEDRLGPAVFAGVCRAARRLPELATFCWTGNELGDTAAFIALVDERRLHRIDFSGTPLRDDWVRVLGELLDRDWQITEIRITDFGPSLAQKIHRNRDRDRHARVGPAFRMMRYAVPVRDDLFDDE
jgi:hypothetical protein